MTKKICFLNNDKIKFYTSSFTHLTACVLLIYMRLAVN